MIEDDVTTYDGIPRMPALFGRQPGPRQRVEDDGGHPAGEGSTAATWAVAQADGDRLARLLPRGFALSQPLLVVEAVSLTGLPWLAGRGYELVSVSVPVRFSAQDSHVHGRLELVTWENCPDAIVSGRDELGFNKIYADSITQRRDAAQHSVSWSAAWGGTEFFTLTVTESDAAQTLPGWNDGPLLHYRVLPRTGQWGELELEQVTANLGVPALTPVSASQGTASFAFRQATFDELPTMVHVVNALAAVELGDVLDAGTAHFTGWGDGADMRIVCDWPTSPATAVALQA